MSESESTMEGAGDNDHDQERANSGGETERESRMGESSAAEGDGDARGRYSTWMRCASQSSLDESSRSRGGARAAGGEGCAGGGEGAAGDAQHAAALLAALCRLRDDEHLTDVRLIAQAEWSSPAAAREAESEAVWAAGAGGAAGTAGGGVLAHRALLAACSPYFRAMFTQFGEAAMPTVTIQNVEPQALESIVEYIYNPDSLVITEDNVQALLSAASLLQVGGVARACCGFLRRALSADNALGIAAFAELHAARDLHAAATAYTHAHASEVLQTEEFLALSAEALAALLQSDHLDVPNEEVILDAVVRWVEHDPEERGASLGSVLQHVRLPLVPQEALVARAAAPPLHAADLAVKDLLIEALSYHLLRPERRAAAAAAAAAAGSARARPRAPRPAPRLLLVVGGQAPKAIREVEALPLEGGGWTVRRELPSRRCRAGLAALRGRVYAVGGFNGAVRVRSVDVYDAGADAWLAGPPLLARRSTLGVAALGDVVYAVGGFDGAAGLSSAERLDVREGAWRALPAMSTRRSSVGVAAYNGQIYAVGGYDGAHRQCLSSVERYDPVADRWVAVAEMGARRSGAGVGVAGGALWALGGHDGPQVRRSVEVYREGGAGGEWTPAPGMHAARRNAGVAHHDDRLYVVGGDDGACNLASVEVLEVPPGWAAGGAGVTGGAGPAPRWTTLPHQMAIARSYAGVVVVPRPT